MPQQSLPIDTLTFVQNRKDTARPVSSELPARPHLPDTPAMEAVLDMVAEGNAIELLIDVSTGHIVQASRGAARFYGYPREKLSRMHLCQLSDIPLQNLMANIPMVLEAGGGTYAVRHRTADGNLQQMTSIATPKQVEGRVFIHSIITPVPEDALEDVSHTVESRYRRIFQRASFGICQTDATSGQVIDANPAMARLLGYDSPAHMVREVGDLLNEHFDGERHNELLRRLRATHDLRNVEVLAFTRAGRPFWVDVSVHPHPREATGAPLYHEWYVVDIDSRVQTTQRLYETQEKLAEAQRIAHIGYFEREVQTGRSYWSDELYQLLGITPRPAQPRPEMFYDLLQPDVRADLQARRDRLTPARPGFIQHFGLCSNGHQRYLVLRGNMDFWPDGSHKRFYGTMQDVTARRVMEQKLKREADFNASMAQVSSELLKRRPQQEIASLVLEHAIALTGASGGFVSGPRPGVDPVTCRGMHPDAGEGRCHNACRTFVTRHLAALWEHVASTHEAVVINDTTRDPRTARLSESPKRGEANVRLSRVLAVPALLGDELLGQIALFNAHADFDELDRTMLSHLAQLFALGIGRQQDRLELEESRSRARMLVEHASDAILLVDESDTVREANPAACRLFGYPREEFIGLDASRLALHPFSFGHVHDLLGGMRETIDMDRTMRHADGSDLQVQGRYSLIEHHGQRFILGFYTDITRRKELERAERSAREQAEQASRLKSDFVANMSHEIRTPVSGILSMAESLLASKLSDEQRADLLLLHEGALSLITIINDILDFSRIEAGKLKLTRAPIRVDQLVRSVVQTFELKAEEAGIELHARVDKNMPAALLGDEGRLRQVLINLVDNGVKFTNAGHVRVEAELAGAFVRAGTTRVRVRFTVTDTGIGIEPRHQSRLFHSFSQVDASYAKPYKGTGLGLAICRQLVEMMEGNISVTSPAAEGHWGGRGCAFTFTVLLELSEQNTLPPPLQPGTGHPTATHTPDELPTGLHILLAEDNRLNRRAFTALLQRAGHRVVSVCDGRAALDALASQPDDPFDLVLMDVQMPRMDGLTAVRRLRSREVHEGLPHTPVVALTAYAMTGDRERLLQAGMDDYASKPLTAQSLARVLRRTFLSSGPDEDVEDPGSTIDQSDTADTCTLPHLDSSRLLHTYDDPQVVDQMLALYVDDGTAELHSACNALQRASEAEGDMHHVRTCTGHLHGLKGMAATIHAHRLHHHLRELEPLFRTACELHSAGLTPDIDELADHLSTTQTLHALLLRAIQTHRNKRT